MNDEALPALNTATLDADTLRQLCFDIEHGARLLSVSIKHHEERNSELLRLEPSELCEALIDGRLLGAQLRYIHAEREWCDTLLSTPGGVRLVRIDHGGV